MVGVHCIVYSAVFGQNSHCWKTFPGDNNSHSGPDYSSDSYVLLEDGTRKKKFGSILEHVYEDVDRPFTSFTMKTTI